MTEFNRVTDTFFAAPQLAGEDFQAAAERGFKVVINNRPDGEEPGQLSSDEAASLASGAGLAYVAAPMSPGNLPAESLEAMRQAIQSADGPVLAYCRSGARSTTMWALIQAGYGDMPIDSVVRAAAEAGYDLSQLEPQLQGMRDHSAGG